MKLFLDAREIEALLRVDQMRWIFSSSLFEIAGKPSHVTNAMKEPWESISSKHRLSLGRWNDSDKSRIIPKKLILSRISRFLIRVGPSSVQLIRWKFVPQQSISVKHLARLFLAAKHINVLQIIAIDVMTGETVSVVSIFRRPPQFSRALLSKSISSWSTRPRSDLRRLDTKCCVQTSYLCLVLISNRQLSDN